MSGAASTARDEASWGAPESVVLHGIPWALYEALLTAAGTVGNKVFVGCR